MTIEWSGFLAVVVVAYVVPGPDLVVVVRAGSTRLRYGLAAAAGAQTGLCVHMLAAACGLSLVLARSPATLRVIQLAGAAYLAWLGARLLWNGRHRDGHHNTASPDPTSLQPAVGWYRQGLTTNLLNPKAILFFVSVLPQFVDPGASLATQVLVLGVVDVVIGLGLWTVWAGIASRLTGLLSRPRVRQRWDQATGGTFIGLGALLASARI